MKNPKLTTLFLLLLSFPLGWAQNLREISGKVSDSSGPLEDVRISIKDKVDSKTFSRLDGSYTIKAQTGDILLFTYAGMKTVSIQIEDVTRFINPIMYPYVNQLDEVIVESSNRISANVMAQRYFERRNGIQSAYGFIDGDRTAGNILFLEQEDIMPVNLGLANLLQNRFPGVSTGILQNLASGVPVFLMRGASMTAAPQPAIFDVDGQVFTNFPNWLDIGNIKRIAIITSLSMTVKYGSLGSGGVVVINTFSGPPTPESHSKKYLGNSEFYEGDAVGMDVIRNNWPEYKKSLYASTSLGMAKSLYGEWSQKYGSAPYFILDAQHFFATEMNDPEFAQQIVEEHYSEFQNNPVLLKALAYQYEVQGERKKANDIYKEIFLLRPHYAQSYLDMARSYRDLGQFNQAAAIHARYNYLLDEGFMEADIQSVQEIMSTEFNNLISMENVLVERQLNNESNLEIPLIKGTRLVFEWNDGEAEFELQFVSPVGQSHVWKHTLRDNGDLIEREKKYGFSTMEVTIDEDLPGTCVVNAKYLGNKSLTPTYLKATIYSDYGSDKQQKEVKLFPLQLKEVNQKLFSFSNAIGVALN
ncbi:hypothetical protein [Maribacter flavus]|uniref:Uncharacterized protein n=1 Tax=Maribacter flavus TaxID=1658664 RepID=A0A5B2TSY8_9FLAO|nr:hypothetical protein [Maribacter flavus]KAA2217349.1 hypothetical protein F0361_15480 [Maribacter flavus]